jgi:hypothetical protein
MVDISGEAWEGQQEREGEIETKKTGQRLGLKGEAMVDQHL